MLHCMVRVMSCCDARGVTIMKKPSTSEGSSVNRVKGTAVIAAPPFFILSYINDFDKSKKWNEMFDYGETFLNRWTGRQTDRQTDALLI